MEQCDFNSITTKVRNLRENIAELHKNYDQLTLNVKVSGNVQHANLDIVQTSIHGVRYAQHLLWQALERSLLKSGSPSVTQKEWVQQAEPQQLFQVPKPRKADSAYTSPSSTENVHQGELLQGFQVLGSGEVIFAHTSYSSKLEETEHEELKSDVSGQPRTYGVKEGEISLRPQKGLKRVDTNIAGVKSCWFFNNTWENVLKGVEFEVTHFITDVYRKYPRLYALKGSHPVTVNRWYKFRALTSIQQLH
ncbi:hypothetical protein ACS0TY_021109 [Phlomoides rotata]